MSKKQVQNSNSGSLIFIVITVFVVIGFFFLLTSKGDAPAGATTVSISGDTQIVEVTYSGGYSPKTINAKAGVKTVLRMKSDGSYGCERSFRIPSLNISKSLPSSGSTDIDLGTQKAGSNIKGTCSMGMYSFVVNFN